MTRESQRRPQEPHRNYPKRLASLREERFKARISRRLIKAQRRREQERLKTMRIAQAIKRFGSWWGRWF